jgi:hypothetical protein
MGFPRLTYSLLIVAFFWGIDLALLIDANLAKLILLSNFSALSAVLLACFNSFQNGE